MGVCRVSVARWVLIVFVACLALTACPSGPSIPKGFVEVRLRPVGPLSASQLSDAADTMAARLQSFGAGTARVDGTSVLATIPENARDRMVALLSKQGRAEFRPVLGIPKTRKISCGGAESELESARATMCVRVGSSGTPQQLALGPARLTNPDIRSAHAVRDAKRNDWSVALQLQPGAAEIFAQLTGELACFKAGSLRRELAISVDGIVESHPPVGKTVRCGKGIVGSFATIAGNSESEAEDLTVLLSDEALPAAFLVVSS